MNPQNPDDAIPLEPSGTNETDQSSKPPPGRRWLLWIKRLLLCNPFYLCSAGLLLYAINRLSVDPNFLSDETRNLLFNFSALQVYELMLIGTAIALAARRVWYDSALLVVLENGLLLLPFMLVSHATFVDKHIAWILTVVAAGAAAGRVYALRRLYPQFRMPPRLLVLGVLVLILNAGLPHVFRWWVEADLEAWHTPNALLWFLAIPVLAAAANLLPRPQYYGGLNPERSWLPLFNYGLWVAGTCVHLWCLNYISRVPFQWFMVAPAVWAGTWTAFYRATDCLPNPPPSLRKAVLLLACLSPALALQHPTLFISLCLLNTVSFVIASRFASDAIRRTAMEFAVISAVVALGAWPMEWPPALSRAEHAAAAATLYCLLLAVRSRDPRIGFVAALALAGAVGWVVRDWTAHAAVQASCAFLLLHSLRWQQGAMPGMSFLRSITAICWMLDAIVWTAGGTLAASGFVAAGATLVLIGWIWQLLRTGVAPSLVIPASAALTFATGPCHWFYSSAPGGIVALAGSIVLFAIGTVIAWYRNALSGDDATVPDAGRK